MSEARELLAQLAAKLRSRAKWAQDDYYTGERDSVRNEAVRETLDGIAADIDELLLPEPKVGVR